MGLLLILIDSSSGWLEVIQVSNKSSIVKQALWGILSRNGIPKTLVFDNAPEFYDVGICQWSNKIGCKVYKTPPYYPQSSVGELEPH